MSAVDYCGGDFSKASSFPDLCPAGQLSIIIKCILVLVIVSGNILIIATIRLYKKLHTTHGDVLFGIAVVDLIIGAIVLPLNMLAAFPETILTVRTRMWKCALIFYTMSIANILSFDYLTIMCVERFLLIWKPIWYRQHVTRRIIMVALSSALAFRLSIGSFITGYGVNTRSNSDKDWSEEECLLWDNLAPDWFNVMSPFILFSQMALSFCLCVLVVLQTRKTLKKSKDSARSTIEKGSLSRKVSRLSDGSRPPSKKTDVMLILMFVFLLLWLPTVMFYTLYAFGIDFSETTLDVGRIIRFANSAVNAPIYVMARQEFRDAFKYLLTSPPWKWNRLTKTLQLQKDWISISRIANYNWSTRHQMTNTSFYNQKSTPQELKSHNTTEPNVNVTTNVTSVCSIDLKKKADSSKEPIPLAISSVTLFSILRKFDTSSGSDDLKSVN